MAVKVTTYNPRFHVTISGIYPFASPFSGTTVTNRFVIDSNKDDIFKKAIHNIQVTRRIGEPASFSITLYPTYDWDNKFSLMSFVKISMTNDQQDHIVFRGFITSIDRSFSIAGGKPQEFIVINGSDWQKIALYPIYYILGQTTNSPIPLPIDILQKWIDGSNSIATGGVLTATQITEICMNQFFQPLLNAFLSAVAVAPEDVPIFFDNDAKTDIVLETELQGIIPGIEARGANNFEPNTSIWEFFTAYQGKPWRELFFDDYDNSPYLIYRSTPWRDINGNFLAPNILLGINPPLSTLLTPADIISYSITRSDTDVNNSFFTYMQFNEPFIAYFKSIGSKFADGSNNPSFPFTLPPNGVFQPSDYRIFGIRFREERVPYLGYTSQNQASDARQASTQETTIKDASSALNQRLVNAMGFNDLLESGSVLISGNPSIHIGQYIVIQKRVQDTAQPYYVEGVNHSFTQPASYGDGSFLTTVMLTRGEGYLGNVIFPRTNNIPAA